MVEAIELAETGSKTTSEELKYQRFRGGGGGGGACPQTPLVSACFACTLAIWVIPNHFNQSFYMTLSELDETWYVSSTCGFVKPDKVSRLVDLWLPS